MHSLLYAGAVIASVLWQLLSPPVAYDWHAHDSAIEAISISPDGVPAAFWCEELHGANARCFAQIGGDPPQPIFRGGALDDGDRSVEPAFRNVRHFSMNAGSIDWNGSVPIFAVACHTASVMGVCEQELGKPPAVAGSPQSPLDAQVARLGSALVWNDVDGSRVVFRAADATLPVCCAGDSPAYALAPSRSADAVLVYVSDSRPAGLRAAIVSQDLAVRGEVDLAQNIRPPERIVAVAAGDQLFVAWSGGGIFTLRGTEVVRLSESGSDIALATDGARVLAVWREHSAVKMAELTRPDFPRSLLGLGANTQQPFAGVTWSQRTGFVAHWRAHSASDRIVVVSRAIP